MPLDWALEAGRSRCLRKAGPAIPGSRATGAGASGSVCPIGRGGSGLSVHSRTCPLSHQHVLTCVSGQGLCQAHGVSDLSQPGCLGQEAVRTRRIPCSVPRA